ncbi:Uncharacterized protein pbN1_07590 [Aromatoleum bremense]|nr:Uncharacterized protein pbN1_07590 [Aromatoleum bremense]
MSFCTVRASIFLSHRSNRKSHDGRPHGHFLRCIAAIPDNWSGRSENGGTYENRTCCDVWSEAGRGRGRTARWGSGKLPCEGGTGDSDRSANPCSQPAPPRYRSRLGDGPAPRTVGNLYTDLHFSAAPQRRHTARLIADPGQAAPARPCCARSPRWRPRSAAASSSRGSGALSTFLTTGCAAAGQRAVRDHARRICVTMKCG